MLELLSLAVGAIRIDGVTDCSAALLAAVHRETGLDQVKACREAAQRLWRQCLALGVAHRRYAQDEWRALGLLVDAYDASTSDFE